MLTDGFVYDWYALFAGWAEQKKEGEVEGEVVRPPHEKVDDLPSKQAQWVYELMEEGIILCICSIPASGNENRQS